jgi:hypothetical protein
MRYMSTFLWYEIFAVTVFLLIFMLLVISERTRRKRQTLISLARIVHMKSNLPKPRCSPSFDLSQLFLNYASLISTPG